MSDTSEPPYEWYGVVEAAEPLAQGDILESLPVIFPISPKHTIEGSAVYSTSTISDYIVLTQSCDLTYSKVDNIVLCPISSLSSHIESNFPAMGEKGKRKYKNHLSDGEVIGWHLLNRCEIPEKPLDYHVVDLKNPIALPLTYIAIHAHEQPSRLRLQPPYREQLSQAFARAFMRVALPIIIPEFT